MIINELLLLILVPFIAAILNLFLPAIIRKIFTAVSLVITSILIYILYRIPQQSFSVFDQIILSADKMSLFVVTFIQVLSIIILIFSLNGVDKDSEKRFFVLYPLTVSFCNAVVLSEHALSFLIFWGLSGLTLYLFGTLGKTHDAPQSAKENIYNYWRQRCISC